jgi:uncharacterized membrane protein YeaQ/YmgE (transglycosylase-associated protein family)
MRAAIHLLFAAIVGYILASALTSAGSSYTAGVFHVAAGTIPTTHYLIANVAIGFVAATIGGYICARLAPASGRIFALALLVLMFLGAAIVMWRVAPAVRQPPGYLPLVTLLDIVALWTGAMVERATTRN